MLSSSSTTRIFAAILPLIRREIHHHPRIQSFLALEVYFTTMITDNTVADAEAETGAYIHRFCGKKRGQHLPDYFAGNTRAMVFKNQAYIRVVIDAFLFPTDNKNLVGVCLRIFLIERIAGVIDNIEEHLLHLLRLGLNPRQSFRQTDR